MVRMAEVHALLNVEQAVKRAPTLPHPSRKYITDAIDLILGKINQPSMTRMDVIRMFRGDGRLICAVGAEVRNMAAQAELPAKREALAAIQRFVEENRRWIVTNHN